MTAQSVGLQALAGIAGSHPLVKTAIKYWWLAIPSGIAMYTLTKERGKITVPGLVADFSISFGPAISLIMLAEFIAAQDKAGNPAQGPVKDASYTINQQKVPTPQKPEFKP